MPAPTSSPLMSELDRIIGTKSKLDLAEEIWRLRRGVPEAALTMIQVTQPNGEPLPAPCAIDGCCYEKFVQAIRDIQTWLDVGEGVSITYYARDCGDEFSESAKLIDMLTNKPPPQHGGK